MNVWLCTPRISTPLTVFCIEIKGKKSFLSMENCTDRRKARGTYAEARSNFSNLAFFSVLNRTFIFVTLPRVFSFWFLQPVKMFFAMFLFCFLCKNIKSDIHTFSELGEQKCLYFNRMYREDCFKMRCSTQSLKPPPICANSSSIIFWFMTSITFAVS